MSNEFDIQDYKFGNFSAGGDVNSNARVVQEFKMPDMSEIKEKRKQLLSNVIKQEREYAREKSFRISEVVAEQRGMREQESAEYEARVEEEVQRRLEAVREDAFAKAYEEGLEKGREIGRDEIIQVAAESLQEFNSMIESVLETRENILRDQKKQIYETTKALVKWVTLKEIKMDEDHYLERLLEKLILELHTKSDLLVKVSPAHFEKMPDILDLIQQHLGKLTNVRVEPDENLADAGIVIESPNGILDASMNVQFENLDRLFESLDVYDK